MSRASERSASIANPPNVSLDALTSLRFFAALAVVFYHSGAGFATNSRIAPTIVENILNNGWLGVPFFFILSGFILTYAHADMHFDHAQLRRFFVARFSRLYPVYILALLICIPFVDHFSFATDWFQFLLLQTWFPNSGATDWNFVAWTLSVEMLFYLVFPFAFVFLRRLSNRALLGGLCVAIGLLLLIWLNMTPQLGDGEVQAYGFVFRLPMPFLRLPEFVYGMILGTLFLRNKFIHSSLTPYAAIFIIVIASGSSTFPAIQTVVLLAFGPLILSLAAASKKEFIRKCLENRILVVLGGASYTLYLLQFPMRKYIAFWVPDQLALYARLAFAPVLICTSVLVFLYYEGPMRKLLRRAFERAAET